MKTLHDEVKQVLRELAALGHVEDTGLRNKGKIVWRLTEKGRKFGEDHPDDYDNAIEKLLAKH